MKLKYMKVPGTFFLLYLLCEVSLDGETDKRSEFFDGFILQGVFKIRMLMSFVYCNLIENNYNIFSRNVSWWNLAMF